jgi:hypothetical protein
MTRRRAVVGLAVLCALCISAFSAASASAKGTTAVECSKSATTKDFEDEHCDKGVTSGGVWGHIAFPNGTAVNVTAVNDLTGTASNFKLMGKIAAVAIEIECTKVSAKGTVTNKEAAGAMSITFGNSSTSFSGCKLLAPASGVGKCKVEVATTNAKETDPMNLGLGEEKVEPTAAGAKVKVLEEGKGTEMGLKFAPITETEPFTTITISNETGQECPAALKGAFPVKGFAYAVGGRGSTEATTSTGATAVFTKASTLGGLTFAGNPATLEGTLTFRKEGGNPLSITTTAS